MIWIPGRLIQERQVLNSGLLRLPLIPRPLLLLHAFISLIMIWSELIFLAVLLLLLFSRLLLLSPIRCLFPCRPVPRSFSSQYCFVVIPVQSEGLGIVVAVAPSPIPVSAVVHFLGHRAEGVSASSCGASCPKFSSSLYSSLDQWPVTLDIVLVLDLI